MMQFYFSLNQTISIVHVSFATHTVTAQVKSLKFSISEMISKEKMSYF
jgi:hypothetical protein